MPRILLLSNGHGEDLSGSLLAKYLVTKGALVDALMLYFSRLFAATKDTAWIEQQEEPENYTERLVEGLLPSQSMRFLSGEGQLMLGKFTGSTTSWPEMKSRLEGHKYWVSELFSTLPSGHTLAQPLLLMFHLRGHTNIGYVLTYLKNL